MEDDGLRAEPRRRAAGPRRAATRAEQEDGRRRFVAGAIGPTNRTLSISPDVNNPGYRAVTFDDLRIAYAEQVRGLIDGGADLILIETIFDTLNAKAAIFAGEEVFAEKGIDLPIMISGTITDLSGRTLSGQTPTAFWNSLRHAEPFTIGLNCALGAARDARRIWPSSRASPTPWSAPIRMPACPTSSASTTRARRRWPRRSRSSRARGSSTSSAAAAASTPEHIRAIAEAVAGIPAARRSPSMPPLMRLSGLEPFTLTPEIPFVNVGERTNVTGSAKFRKLITDGDYAAALDVAREQVETGAQIIDVNMDEGLLDSQAGDGRLPQPDRRRARHRPRAGDDRLLQVGGDRGRA